MHQDFRRMVQPAVLGRWMAEVAGLSRFEDKQEEFVSVSCGLSMGRGLHQEAHVAGSSTAALRMLR